MDEATVNSIALSANFAASALLILIKCLERNGALKSEQVKEAIQMTLVAAGEDRNRLDYRFLGCLLDALERQQEPLPSVFDIIDRGKLH